MDYGMIGKIEKAKRYAQEPERVSLHTLTAELQGDNDVYTINLGPEGWTCTCARFHIDHICPHIMAMEKILKPMLKVSPLPYGRGQNMISDIEKAARYAQETDRIHILVFEAGFRGDNGTHQLAFDEGAWACNCSFFQSRHTCCHTMTMERMLKGMIRVAEPV